MSLTNRLRRFLSNERIKPRAVYRPVALGRIRRFEATDSPLRLIVDTTQCGSLMTVSLGYRRRALPLAWRVVAKRKGHLSSEEQIEVFETVASMIAEIEKPPEVLVLGDSEFSSVEVMRFFKAKKWHFIVRLRGHYTVDRQGTWVRLCEMGLSEGATQYLGAVSLTKKHCFACQVVLHWKRGEDEPWFLASDLPVGAQTLRHHRLRMWTEELYGELKGHGFDLEATRLASLVRLERLVLGVCLVYIWLIVLGSRVVKNGQRHLVDRKDRRDRSYFRIGWDFLMRCLCLGEPIPVKYHLYL